MSLYVCHAFSTRISLSARCSIVLEKAFISISRLGATSAARKLELALESDTLPLMSTLDLDEKIALYNITKERDYAIMVRILREEIGLQSGSPLGETSGREIQRIEDSLTLIQNIFVHSYARLRRDVTAWFITESSNVSAEGVVIDPTIKVAYPSYSSAIRIANVRKNVWKSRIKVVQLFLPAGTPAIPMVHSHYGDFEILLPGLLSRFVLTESNHLGLGTDLYTPQQ